MDIQSPFSQVLSSEGVAVKREESQAGGDIIKAERRESLKAEAVNSVNSTARSVRRDIENVSWIQECGNR